MKDILLYGLGAAKAGDTEYINPRLDKALSDEAKQELPAVWTAREGAEATQPETKITVTTVDESGKTNTKTVDADAQEKAYQKARQTILQETENYIYGKSYYDENGNLQRTEAHGEFDENGNIIKKNYIKEYMEAAQRAADEAQPDDDELPEAYIPEGEGSTNSRKGISDEKINIWPFVAAGAGCLIVTALLDTDKKK